MAVLEESPRETAPSAEEGPWRELVHSMNCGIIAVDLPGNLIFANPSARRILELGPGCRGGRPVREILKHHHALRQVLLEAPGLHALPNRAETEVRFPDGRRKTIGFTATVLRNPSGDPTGSAILFKDLTQIERTEEQERLRDRLAALGQMAAGMAHEVRNPLASIQVTATLLQRQLARDGQEGPAPLVEKILQEVQRVDQTMAECLEYVKPLTPVLQPCRVEEILEESITHTASEFPDSEIRISREYAPGLPALEADRGLLRHVFRNILRNAFEALGGRGRLRLRVALEPDHPALEGGCLKVSIRDDGPGIPRELQEKLFYPFFTTKKSGSGLGLAVSKKILEIHGGLIDVQSEPGRGTTFLILFPRAQGGASHNRRPDPTRIESGSGGKRGKS